jgi:hypothetical protein
LVGKLVVRQQLERIELVRQFLVRQFVELRGMGLRTGRHLGDQA